jgi:trehalose 6-phosphate synthase
MLDAGLMALVDAQAERLERLSAQVFQQRTLLVASNRGPVEYRATDRGLEGARGAGGLVTAVSAINRYVSPRWVAAAMSEGDRQMAAEAQDSAIHWESADSRFDLRYVTVDPEIYNAYYNTISNPLLWFLQHYMWDAPRTPVINRQVWEAWEAYHQVNQAFADILVQEAERSPHPPVLMLHDYHLYFVPQLLRDRGLPPGSCVTFFLHIPWPGSDYWGLLPQRMRREILESLCQCDILGFQTTRFLRNFLNTCLAYLPEAEIDYNGNRITFAGHTVHLKTYPISIDVRGLVTLAGSDEVRSFRQRLRPYTSDQTIVRIDRVEPSKNIVRGFQAYEQLLETHPEYRGRVKFVAILVPSRLGVEEYQRYLEEIMIVAGWINTRYGNEEWQPVELVVGDNYARAIAAMQLYDVLMVNPIIDGMNLVAKEGVVANEKDGVLILSEGAGAAEQLSQHALVISPSDILGTMEALRTALEMPVTERHARATALREQVAREDLSMWLAHQFHDIQRLFGGANDIEATVEFAVDPEASVAERN